MSDSTTGIYFETLAATRNTPKPQHVHRPYPDSKPALPFYQRNPQHSMAILAIRSWGLYLATRKPFTVNRIRHTLFAYPGSDSRMGLTNGP